MLAPLALAMLVVGEVQLTWSAPDGCPPAAELAQQLAPELNGAAIALVTADPQGFSLELRVNGALRTLQTPTCDEAAQAAVFFIRVGLQKSEVMSEAVEPQPAPAPTERWSFGGTAIAGVALVGLPRPLARFGGALRVQRGPWAGTLDVTTSLAHRFAGGPTPSAAVTLREPLDAQLGACRLATVAQGWLALGPCLHVAFTWLSATGENVSNPKQTSVALWAVGPGARAYLIGLPWLEVFASVVTRFGSRPSVFFEGSQPLVEGAPVSLELSLGAGIRF